MVHKLNRKFLKTKKSQTKYERKRKTLRKGIRNSGPEQYWAYRPLSQEIADFIFIFVENQLVLQGIPPGIFTILII